MHFNHHDGESEAAAISHPMSFYLQFATEGYVLLLALKVTQSEALATTPLPGDDDGQMRWLQNVATQIVSFCWEGERQEDVRVAKLAFETRQTRSDGRDLYPHCDCGEGHKI